MYTYVYTQNNIYCTLRLQGMSPRRPRPSLGGVRAKGLHEEGTWPVRGFAMWCWVCQKGSAGVVIEWRLPRGSKQKVPMQLMLNTDNICVYIRWFMASYGVTCFFMWKYCLTLFSTLWYVEDWQHQITCRECAAMKRRQRLEGRIPPTLPCSGVFKFLPTENSDVLYIGACVLRSLIWLGVFSVLLCSHLLDPWVRQRKLTVLRAPWLILSVRVCIVWSWNWRMCMDDVGVWVVHLSCNECAYYWNMAQCQWGS